MTVQRHKKPVDPTKEILKGLTSYLEGADQATDQGQTEEAAPPAAKKRRPMNINKRALESARGKIQRKTRQQLAEVANIFKPAQVAPGVLPSGETLAMDEVIGSGSAFGAVSDWAWNGGTQFAEGTTFLGYPYLAELTQRPEYRKGVERIATEMTRKWISLEVTSEVDGTLDDAAKKQRGIDKGAKIKEIEKEMTLLKVRDAFRVAIEHDGYFGRGHLFLDVGKPGDPIDYSELTAPLGTGGKLSKEKVSKRNPLRALRNVEPMWAYPQTYNSTDPLRSDWYKPSTWYVMTKAVHATRFLTLVGREVPDILKPAYAFGGLAMTQMAKPYVDNWLRTRQAVCDLIESFSVSGVYTNMASTLQAGFGGDGDEGGDGGVIDRMELFNLIRTNSGSMVLDKETEEFFNITTPLGTLDALQAQAQEQLASVWSIPVAILLGLQPKGLNASSEAEVRIFYDFLGSAQENLVRDPLKVVIDAIQLSLWNEVDEDITFKFEPLWALSEKERAEVKKVEVETGQILIDAGVIHPEEERRRVADDKDMGYNAIDVEDVPEPPAEPDMGGGDDDEENPDAPDGDDQDGKDAPAQDEGIVPFLVSGDSSFNEADHPRDGGKFAAKGSGSSKSGAKAALAPKKDMGRLKPHPPEQMREYTPKELDWEYGTEYLKYSKSAFPDAFSSREDFQAKYDAAPVVALSEKELKSLGNSMAAQGLGKSEKWIHDTFSHRRDSTRIIKEMKEGKTAPPIILKSGDRMRLMAGQTRLATGAALGISIPAKIIDVSKKPAQDEKPFDEAKHPRAPDGKFGSGSGSSSLSEKPGAGAKKAVTAFGGLWKDTGKGEKADYHATVDYYLAQAPKSGTHYRNMLTKLIADAGKHGLTDTGTLKLKQHLYHAYQAVKNKLSDEFSAGVPPEKQKELGKLFDAAVKKQKDLGLSDEEKSSSAPSLSVLNAVAPAKPSVTQTVAAQALKDNPGMAAVVAKSKGEAKPASYPTPTAAETKAAQKTIPYPIHLAQSGEGVDAINEFNAKWQGKNPDGKIPEKVTDFKVMQAKVQAANLTNAEANQKAAQEAAAKEAKAFEDSLNSPRAKEHYAALNGIMSGSAKGALSHAKAKLNGLGQAYEKVTPGEAAQVIAYSGSFYREVNNQLRAGVMTEEQYKFASSLNQALDALPKKPGVTVRGTTLPPGILASYQPGAIVEERGFTSTGVGKKFSGTHTFEIHGHTGRDISMLSQYPGEKEVLFKAGTRFRVKSRTGNHIVMEEVKFG